MEEKSMTVKELKEFIKDLPDTTDIYVGTSNNPELTKVEYKLIKHKKNLIQE